MACSSWSGSHLFLDICAPLTLHLSAFLCDMFSLATGTLHIPGTSSLHLILETLAQMGCAGKAFFDPLPGPCPVMLLRAWHILCTTFLSLRYLSIAFWLYLCLISQPFFPLFFVIVPVNVMCHFFLHGFFSDIFFITAFQKFDCDEFRCCGVCCSSTTWNSLRPWSADRYFPTISENVQMLLLQIYDLAHFLSVFILGFQVQVG